MPPWYDTWELPNIAVANEECPRGTVRKDSIIIPCSTKKVNRKLRGEKMKFKTKQEKRAFRMGCAVGRKQKRNNKKTNQPAKLKPNRTEFPADFEYTDNGYIKGSYTCDGFFEPD